MLRDKWTGFNEFIFNFKQQRTILSNSNEHFRQTATNMFFNPFQLFSIEIQCVQKQNIFFTPFGFKKVNRTFTKRCEHSLMYCNVTKPVNNTSAHYYTHIWHFVRWNSQNSQFSLYLLSLMTAIWLCVRNRDRPIIRI